MSFVLLRPRIPVADDEAAAGDVVKTFPATISVQLTWDVALALVIVGLTLGVSATPTSAALIPAALRAGLAFAAVLLAPGLLATRLLVRRGEIDPIQRVAIAYPLSLAFLSPLGFVLLL